MLEAIGSFLKRVFVKSNPHLLNDESIASPFKPYPVIKSQISVPAGVGYSSTNAGGSKWNFGLSSTGSSPLLNHRVLRQNARSVFHDTIQAKAIVNRFADNIVDIGLKLEPTPKYDIIGISPEDAEMWSAKVGEAFDCWASSKKSLKNETMNFYQAQRLAEIFQQRDNDYFVRLYYTDSDRLISPLQIAFIDPNQIYGDTFTDTLMFNDANISDGIIKDEFGRETGYIVYTRDQREGYKPRLVPAFSEFGLPIMLHGYQPEYAGQSRGYSRLSHAVQEFENLTDFTLAQIKKAINQSNIMMYVKPSDDNDASNVFDEIMHRGYGSAPIVPETAENVTEDSTLPLEDYVRYIPLPEATITKPGSVGVFNLKSGEDLKAFEGTSPAESYDRFVDAFTSHLAASVDMPLEVLLMKFNQNYSASRAALILFWRVIQIWKQELKADFNDPIYEAWLQCEIAAGRVSCPGWQDPRVRQAWVSNVLIGQPMPNIDPAKTAIADKAYAEMGAQTLDRIAQEYNGSSGKSNRAKLKREFAELPPSPFKKGE